MSWGGVVSGRLGLAVGVLLVAGNTAGCSLLGLTEPTPWRKPAKVDGDIVYLTYTGSKCS